MTNLEALDLHFLKRVNLRHQKRPLVVNICILAHNCNE